MEAVEVSRGQVVIPVPKEGLKTYTTEWRDSLDVTVNGGSIILPLLNGPIILPFSNGKVCLTATDGRVVFPMSEGQFVFQIPSWGYEFNVPMPYEKIVLNLSDEQLIATIIDSVEQEPSQIEIIIKYLNDINAKVSDVNMEHLDATREYLPYSEDLPTYDALVKLEYALSSLYSKQNETQ
jgi:hypothetical protein